MTQSLTAPDWQLAVETYDFTAYPWDTWMSEAKRRLGRELYGVVGKNFYNTVQDKRVAAVVTMHRRSDARKFREKWETLGMTDLVIMRADLQWEECE